MNKEEMVEAALQGALEALIPQATWNESSEGVFDVPCNDAARVVVSLREALGMPLPEPVRLARVFAEAERIYAEKKCIPWTEAIEEAMAKHPAQHFDHTADANAALRDAQARSYQVAQSMQLAAWQDKANPAVLVAAEDWDNIDPIWHWMYRPLFALKSEEDKSGN